MPPPPPPPPPPLCRVTVLQMSLSDEQWLPTLSERPRTCFTPSGRWLLIAHGLHLKAYSIALDGDTPSVSHHLKKRGQKEEWVKQADEAHRGQELVGREAEGGVVSAKASPLPASAPSPPRANTTHSHAHGSASASRAAAEELVLELVPAALPAGAAIAKGGGPSATEGVLLLRRHRLEAWAIQGSEHGGGAPHTLTLLASRDDLEPCAACAVQLTGRGDAGPPIEVVAGRVGLRVPGEPATSPTAQMWLVGTASHRLLLLRDGTLEAVASVRLAPPPRAGGGGEGGPPPLLTSLALSRPSEGGSARLACGYANGCVAVHDLRDLSSEATDGGAGLGVHDWLALGLGGAR